MGEAFQSMWQEYGSDCTLGLLFRLDLPGGYLLGAYTDGAYLLGGGFIRAQLSVPPMPPEGQD